MRKIALICCIFVASVFMYSCEEENIQEKSVQGNEKVILSPDKMMIKNKLEETAVLLATIVDSEEIHQEVYQKIQTSIGFNLDEELRFVEILDNKSEKINLKSSSVNSRLGSKLKNIFSSSLKSAIYGDIENFMLEGNVQIYWPYSDNWDGKSEPVFTYDPMNDADENIGFKRILSEDGVISFDTVIINDEYCYNNPVWIINMNNVAYDDLPEFTKGEFAKNGIAYLQQNSNLKSATSINAFDDPTKVYEVQVGQMKCKSQYDNVFQGGSEFIFKMVGVDSTFYTADYQDKIRTDFTRKQIRKKTKKSYYTSINDDWGVVEPENGFILYEEDDNDANASMKGSLAFEGVSVSYELVYDERDNVLYEKKAWDRGVYFAQTKGIGDSNATFWGDWRVFKAGDVEWTMPYVIHPKY